MACFPRLRVFHRTKNSFNPAEDENTDTILKNDDNAVQIGRYIRREETPLFAPKISERSQQQQNKLAQQNGQQQQLTTTQPQQQRHEQQLQQQNIVDQHNNHINKNDVNANNSKNSNNNNNNNNNNNINGNGNSFVNSNTSNTSNTQNASNNSNNAPKKFISNKGHLQLQLQRNNSNNSNSNATQHNYHNNIGINYSGSGVSNKLKPAKGRRPTALPNEVPHIEEDGALGDTTDGNALTNGEITPTTPIQIVRFYIGAAQHASGDVDNCSSVSANSLDADTHSGKHKLLLAAAAADADYAPNSGRATPTTTSAAASPTPAQRNGSINSIVSSVANFSPPDRKSRTKHTRKVLRGQEPPADDIHIPPPPPLPPQPLTTVSSSASLLSIKTKHSSGHAHNNAGTSISSIGGVFEEGGISANTELGTAPLTPTETHTNVAGICISNGTATTNDKDQTPSPKDSDQSDTPQTRLEGGLIFTRPNLPTKKDVHIEFIEKDEDTRNLIRKAIERNDFLNNYMDKERKEMVIAAMAPTFYEKDSYIIHENDEGSEIYVSETGYFDVIKGGKLVGSFGPATVFGELAILYNANRLASVRVTSNARVWKITRETFRQIMVLSESKEREENLNFLRSAPFLNDLAPDVLNKIVDLLQRKYYEPNACIVREGEVGNEFFIIRGGTVTIKKKNEQNVERIVDRRKRGDYFGEQALLNADRRQASVYADAPGTEVLKLDREAFISYLGTIPQLREKPERRNTPETRPSSRKSEFDNEYAHVQLSELKKVATLGAGAFGRVDLVAYANKTFALKIIKKIDVIKQDQVEHVYSEKQVMMKCRSSPFIIELYKTFRNEKFVYFLMEACMGGDVWTMMSQRRFFDEKTAKFVAGCVVEAFDFLHSHDIIYRDLKPENLMLTTDGYCKLVDFGFAKHIPRNQKTNTFAGTPEYVAPEIILDRGHDRAVDYWALGILIFELLVGKTPFREQNQIKIYQQILGGIDVIQMPSKIPRSAQSLIKQLCKQLPVERLGYQRRGILDIKKHSWFDSLDWNKLKYKQLPSPIKRPISSNTDIQYFGPAGVENEYDPPDETSGWDIDF